MVEINNQRKAFPGYAGVVGGTDNGRQKPEIMVMTSVRWRESYAFDYPITSQTCHAKPKTQINRRRTLPASS